MGCAIPVAFTSVTSAMAIMSDAFTRSLTRRFLTPTEWEHTGISAQSVRPQQRRRKFNTFLPPGFVFIEGAETGSECYRAARDPYNTRVYPTALALPRCYRFQRRSLEELNGSGLYYSRSRCRSVSALPRCSSLAVQ